MLTTSRSRMRRRGIVLVLVLAMLGLLALVAVTFATFANQARMNNKSFMNSLLQPQADELIDFALAQLITDTNDRRSVIRGHSMARDMFGGDAINNGFLILSPSNGQQFSITAVTAVGGGQYDLTTNIASGDPNFFGYQFQRWIIQVSFPNTQTVAQTFEVVGDSQAAANRVLRVNIGPSDGQLVYPVGAATPTIGTNLSNPTLNLTTILPGQMLIAAVGGTVPANTFTLDGRWLHAFNGSGAGSTLATSGLPASYYPNFRYNGAIGGPGLLPGLNLGDPSTLGMDEDYDACDLENWFLAVQSADGHVTIPSFHRPGIIRWDVPNGINDWLRQNQSNPPANGGGALWAESAARILRPCQIDGHDSATFPDLYPDPTTGQIPYDVDNDGDRVPDSVWLDLGYPARRDPSGRLYKPLFAFMVIGLNGRIPLNTAGNLAAQVGGVFVPPAAAGATPPPPTMMGGPGHAAHLGNSISEVDPTYGLQNAFDINQGDVVAAFARAGFGIPTGPGTSILPSNSQVDNAGVDVRLTQLRHLLAGTRPQTNSSAAGAAAVNGDNNFVAYSLSSSNEGISYFMPNGIADLFGDLVTADANTGLPFLLRTTPPVPGRWGEAQSIPGASFPNPFASAVAPVAPVSVNVVNSNYTNPVRAGYSINIRDIINGLPPDAADDNYNTFDPFPYRTSTDSAGNTVYGGEVNDADAYDAAGALLFPIDRMRRWLAPIDINGTGQVDAWNPGSRGVNRGYDVLGRVEFNSYFRPPGAPGVINTAYSNTGYSTTGIVTYTDTSVLPGAISYPATTPAVPDPFYTGGPGNQPPYVGTIAAPAPLVSPAYLPDITNNPLHGFESFRFPNQAYAGNGFTPQNIGGSPTGILNPAAPPAYLDVDTNNIPTTYPSYDFRTNTNVHSDGLNDADEMNLYSANPLLDSAYGPADLEWLYRQQDIDGASLTSRLSKLAPISFTNGLDGSRRRKLYALDSWDLNRFVWSNDNPSNAFSTNRRFGNGTSATMQTLGFATPSLAHGDKKINLNYPLPVSNDPNEPIRQKWILDTYTLLRNTLPPKAVDTPEELAQLSQYVINIIDFRDPDSTMTHWVNPDVMIAGIPAAPAAWGAAVTLPTTAATLVPAAGAPPTAIALDQYGMEYNPVAINEVLAYSFVYATTAAGALTRSNRFFAELVNTQTSPELAAGSTFNPVLSLGGFTYSGLTSTPVGPTDPYSGGSWDIVFTADDPYSRPDPYRGQLLPFGNTYGLTPLNRDTFTPLAAGIPSSDVILTPLGQSGSIPAPTMASATTMGADYFYTFGNTGPGATFEKGGPTPGTNLPTNANGPPGQNGQAQANGTTYYVPGTPAVPATTPPTYMPSTPSLMQTLTTTMDPLSPTPLTASPVPIYNGVLPLPQTANNPALPTTLNPNPSTMTLPSNYATDLPSTFPMPTATMPSPGTPLYYWVCLRRPLNLFAPVSLTNPLVVVDSMRFPYFDGTGPLTTMGTAGTPPNLPNLAAPTGGTGGGGAAAAVTPVFSAQRYQPYRGGHAVPVPSPGALPPPGAAAQSTPVDPRYGYTEQLVVPSVTLNATQGIFFTGGGTTYYSTLPIYHTIGWANEFEQGSLNSQAEPWDYFPFHDRDFSSVAELMLVPGSPPGLFTKQFVEFAPSQANNTSIFGAVIPLSTPPTFGPNATIQGPATATGANPTGTPPVGGTITTKYLQAFNTASTPLYYVSGYGGSSAPTTPIEPHTFPYLNDEFFYSGYGGAITIDPGAQVGGYAADGWFKMFEFFEVPSQVLGAIGPVAQGSNFDWLRQDLKPGQLNLNLIMDEEVFFGLAGQQTVSQANGQYETVDTTTTPPTITPKTPSDQYAQQLLNFTQVTGIPIGNYVAGATTAFSLPLAAGSSPMPMVVTSTLANGSPGTAYPLGSSTLAYTTPAAPVVYPQGGVTSLDPITNYFYNLANPGLVPTVPPYSNSLKTAWVQFLTLRHGGSGYLFGFGQGAVGQNWVVTPTTPLASGAAPALYGTGLPAERPFHSLSYPDIDFTVMRPAALPPSLFTNPPANDLTTDYATTPPTYYAGDPGVRNPTMYLPYPTMNYPGTLPTGYVVPPGVVLPTSNWSTLYEPVLPPAIPVRRLFQVPDTFTGGTTIAPATVPSGPSNAGETGDPAINNLTPLVPVGATIAAPYNYTGSLPPILFTNSAGGTPVNYAASLTGSVVNLYWPGANAATLTNVTTTPGTPVTPGPSLPAGTSNPYLGSGSTATNIDQRQHPYWRTEQLQKMINLTTSRTHQYAVWITIGFFEVKRQGDLGMFSYNPQLAFDILGPEIGAANGKSTRFRGFYLVDRLQLTGFNPSSPSAFRSAVVYRQRIQ
jgi:large repetitive protein